MKALHPCGRWAALATTLACGRVDTTVGAEIAAAPVYIEAEDGQLSGGFIVESDPTASGGEYILPPAVTSTDAPGAAAAEYVFRANQPGSYVVWGRIHGPGASNNSFWITVDGVETVGIETIRWRLSTGVIWYWAPLTRDTDYGDPVVFQLDAGIHHLAFRNCEPGVGLDRLYITTAAFDGGGIEPPNHTKCDPPNSIQLADASCQDSCGSLLGSTCGAQVCAGFVPLPAYDCTFCCRVLDGGSNDASVE
jgi:hypothetical protein